MMAAHPLAILAVVFSSLFGALGSLFFKFSSRKISLKIISIITNLNLMLGLAFAGTGAILFIVALRYGDLSILYPIISLQYVWISLLSIRFLRERMNTMKWIGIVLIMLGVIATNIR